MINLFKSKKTKKMEGEIKNQREINVEYISQLQDKRELINKLYSKIDELKSENEDLKNTGFELQQALVSSQKEVKELYDLYAPLRDRELNKKTRKTKKEDK